MAFNIADFPEALLAPHQMSDISAWISHLPMVPVLLKLLQPRSFVELGTHAGDSYLGFCNNVRRLRLPTTCTAVDTWEGDPQAGFYGDTVFAILDHENRAHYGGFSRLLRTTFDQAATTFAEGSIDLLHIDGLHTYEAVRHDYETWLPKMSPRGVVLFHDAAVESEGFGVRQLWYEISAGKPNFLVPYGFGLGLLAVGREVPAPFLAFLDELHAHPEYVLRPFLALAERNDMMSRNIAFAHGVRRLFALCAEWEKHHRRPVPELPAIQEIFAQPGPAAAAAYEQIRRVFDEALAAESRGTSNPPAVPPAPMSP